MKILLTGGTGLIGRDALRRTCCAMAMLLTVLSRTPGHPWRQKCGAGVRAMAIARRMARGARHFDADHQPRRRAHRRCAHGRRQRKQRLLDSRVAC
jgi:NAD dependent epimerase/dehydratase family enzyme